METPQPGLLAPVIEKLIAAERPVIIAGRGARAANAKEDIVKLADRVGALLATSLQGKGYFAGQPWDIGIAGAFASAPSEQLLADADFVLGVGAELGYYTTEGGLLFPSAEVARIDIKPMPEQIGVMPGLYVQGDGRRRWRRSMRRWRRARCARQGSAPPRQRPCWTSRRIISRRRVTVLIRVRWRAILGAGAAEGCVADLRRRAFLLLGPAMYTPLPEGAEIQCSYHFGAVGQGIGWRSAPAPAIRAVRTWRSRATAA